MINSFIQSVIQQIPLNTTETGNVTLPALPPLTLANLFGDLTSTLIIITIMAAVTVRTYSEYIEKLMKGEITTFNPKYIATAFIGFLSSLPLALTLFPEAAKVFLAYVGEWGVAGALVMAGIYAYGWQHGTNKIASLVGHFFTAKTPEQKEDSQ